MEEVTISQSCSSILVEVLELTPTQNDASNVNNINKQPRLACKFKYKVRKYSDPPPYDPLVNMDFDDYGRIIIIAILM